MSLFERSAKSPALLFYVLLLLLVTSSSHADQTSANVTPVPAVDNSTITSTTPTTQTPNANVSQTYNGTTIAPQVNDNSTSHIQNDTGVEGTENKAVTDLVNITTEGNATSISPTPQPTTRAAVTTQALGPTERESEESSGGALLAFLIIFFLAAIIGLGILLFRLYKKSRSYSFDLSSSPFNEQASDNTPLKTVEMETFHPKDTDDQAVVPSVVTESADKPPASPAANGSVEAGPGDPVITLDSGSSKSDSSECGSQTECLPEESTDVEAEQQPGNENNNNFTVVTKAIAGLESRQDNFTEISLT